MFLRRRSKSLIPCNLLPQPFTRNYSTRFPSNFPFFHKSLSEGEKFLSKDSISVLSSTRPNSPSFVSYRELYHLVDQCENGINETTKATAGQQKICLIAPPGLNYTKWMLYSWQNENFFVPLNWKYTLNEWEYVIQDVEPDCIVIVEPQAAEYDSAAREEFMEKVQQLSERLSDSKMEKPPQILMEKEHTAENISTNSSSETPRLSPEKDISLDSNALMIYTSGTTSKPKGVVLTYANVLAQIETMIDPWKWTSEDRLLHVLPMHHTHGIINGLGCAVYSAAAVQFMPFNESNVLNTLSSGDQATLFFGVPTIYSKLLTRIENNFTPEEASRLKKGCERMRLMVSGSAALPPPVLDRWRNATGHTLLERYGMTEIGMCLTNPLEPVNERRPGFVGKPFPGVEVKVVDKDSEVSLDSTPCKGELLVKGPNVFKEYWKKPEATKKEFVDGWFKTGDAVEYVDGAFRILGRQSVDIIKTGGYKVSALEIEAVLLQNSLVKECAVVGVQDAEWGETILAFVVAPLNGVNSPDSAEQVITALQEHCKGHLTNYKVPRKYVLCSHIPRNAMGKINKKNLLSYFNIEPGT